MSAVVQLGQDLEAAAVVLAEVDSCCFADLEGQSVGDLVGIGLDLVGSPGRVDQSTQAEAEDSVESQVQGRSLLAAEDQSRDHIGEVDNSQGIVDGENDQEEGRRVRHGSEVVPGEGLASKSSIDVVSLLESCQSLESVLSMTSSIRRKATEISTWFCAFGTGL